MNCPACLAGRSPSSSGRYKSPNLDLFAQARTAIDAWLAPGDLPGSDGPALFVSLKSQRLSARAIDLAVRRLGQEADVQLSADTLRHTCLTRLVRAGNDIVLVEPRRTLPARNHPPIQPPQRRRPTSSHGHTHRRLLIRRQTAAQTRGSARLLLTPH